MIWRKEGNARTKKKMFAKLFEKYALVFTSTTIVEAFIINACNK